MRSELLCSILLFASAAFAEPLVGGGVGNADTFVSEGSKLFNKKQYAKAADQFLKAMADGPDRKKAAAESDQCERQLKGLRKPPEDPTKSFVDQRAAFFTALDAKELLGPTSASQTLRALVQGGFLGPELGEMASRLGAAATAEAESVHKRALSGEKLSGETLRSARPLYQVAQDVGVPSGDAKGRMAFLDGLAELEEKAWKKAEAHFAEAAKSDPANKEYVFFKGLALVQAGERAAALKVLESDLKDDPRTAMLRAALALGDSPVAGAAELEKLLFNTRYPPEK